MNRISALLAVVLSTANGCEFENLVPQANSGITAVSAPWVVDLGPLDTPFLTQAEIISSNMVIDGINNPYPVYMAWRFRDSGVYTRNVASSNSASGSVDAIKTIDDSTWINRVKVVLRGGAFFGYILTDTNNKTYDVRPRGGDDSNEEFESEVLLRGPPLGFLGNKATRIESLGIKQYVSFCKDARIRISDFDLPPINLTYMQKEPVVINHPTPSHDFDHFATKCQFKYVTDDDKFLTTNEDNSAVEACGHKVGTNVRALTATILNNEVVDSIPLAKMVEINVTPDCSMVTFNPSDYPTMLHATPGKTSTTPYTEFSYEEE